MRKQRRIIGVCASMLVVALASLGLAGSASAKLVEPYIKFQYCPWHNPEVARCQVAVTESGEVVLGSKKVPIVNPVTIQGGFSEPDETKFAKFFEATNKVTLSKTPQPVPGGLAGLVPPESSPPIVKEAIKFFFENKLTGVESTLELARPASEIKISEANLSRKEGVAFVLPLKVHLENPFLGSSCYVGSESAPIYWNLTSGLTSPKAPNKPIEGKAGKVTFLEEGLILHLSEDTLVDNNWSAPEAHGCGGFPLELLVDPIINAASGLPAAAGKNTAILHNTIDITTPFALELIEEENP